MSTIVPDTKPIANRQTVAGFRKNEPDSPLALSSMRAALRKTAAEGSPLSSASPTRAGCVQVAGPLGGARATGGWARLCRRLVTNPPSETVETPIGLNLCPGRHVASGRERQAAAAAPAASEPAAADLSRPPGVPPQDSDPAAAGCMDGLDGQPGIRCGRASSRSH